MTPSEQDPMTRATARAWGSVAPVAKPPDTTDWTGPVHDVVVLGAGITGLTTAVLLRRAGVDVLVVEAREPGAGTTGGTSGKVTVMQGQHVQQIRSRHGDDTTADYLAAAWPHSAGSPPRRAATNFWSSGGPPSPTPPAGRVVGTWSARQLRSPSSRVSRPAGSTPSTSCPTTSTPPPCTDADPRRGHDVTPSEA